MNPPLQKLRDFLWNECRARVNETQVQTLYNLAVSIHQSKCSRSGKDLETRIEQLLQLHNIPFIKQACVHPIEHTIVPPGRGLHRHDIILNAAIGDSIRDKIIISCKVSLRERFLQDSKVPCRRLFMVTSDTRAMKKKDELRTIHDIHLVHTSQDMDQWIQEIKGILAADRVD